MRYPQMEEEIKKLKERIEELEMRPRYIPYYPPTFQHHAPYYPTNPNLHYHGAQPCYNNPCVWC
jgi:hypothetical protein